MPKVRANLNDVSTEFTPASPDDYELKIDKFDLISQGGRDTYKYVLVIDQPGHEEHGKSIFGNISMHKRDGSENVAGQRELKRYFEAVFGKEEVADPSFDYDTDYLLQQRIGGSVVIEAYEYEKDGQTKKGQSNRVDRIWKL